MSTASSVKRRRSPGQDDTNQHPAIPLREVGILNPQIVPLLKDEILDADLQSNGDLILLRRQEGSSDEFLSTVSLWVDATHRSAFNEVKIPCEQCELTELGNYVHIRSRLDIAIRGKEHITLSTVRSDGRINEPFNIQFQSKDEDITCVLRHGTLCMSSSRKFTSLLIIRV